VFHSVTEKHLDRMSCNLGLQYGLILTYYKRKSFVFIHLDSYKQISALPICAGEQGNIKLLRIPRMKNGNVAEKLR
jgi:hypothetical protein